jgi:hypothetical protein
MALAAAFGIGATIANSLMCIPLSKMWNPKGPGTCLNIPALFISTSVIGMLFDFALILIPVPILWGLKCKSIGTKMIEHSDNFY